MKRFLVGPPRQTQSVENAAHARAPDWASWIAGATICPGTQRL